MEEENVEWYKFYPFTRKGNTCSFFFFLNTDKNNTFSKYFKNYKLFYHYIMIEDWT